MPEDHDTKSIEHRKLMAADLSGHPVELTAESATRRFRLLGRRLAIPVSRNLARACQICTFERFPGTEYDFLLRYGLKLWGHADTPLTLPR